MTEGDKLREAVSLLISEAEKGGNICESLLAAVNTALTFLLAASREETPDERQALELSRQAWEAMGNVCAHYARLSADAADTGMTFG